MNEQPTYEELEQRVGELEKELLERKQTEQELLFNKNIISSSSSVIATCDLEGSMSYGNPSFLKTWGFDDAKEFVGRHFSEFWVVQERLDEIMQALRSKGKWFGEIKAKRKDGTLLDVQISAATVYDAEGNPVALTSTSIDITDRKQAEEELQKSEARYRLLIENLPNIVFQGYKDWSVDFIDDRIELLTGYKKEEFNSRKVQWADIVVKEDINYMKKVFIKALKTDKSYLREYRIKNRAGDILWIQEGSQIVCDEKGEIEFVSGAFLNITEHKQLEYKLQQAQRMEAIATLAGGIAHQFNNALSGITGNIDLLQINLPEDEKIREYIEPMKVSAQRMAILSDQLLAYARGGKYQPKVFPINQFLADTLPVLKHIIVPGIRVETSFSKDISNIEADATQMQMILSDVLINSSEAIEGEGRIRITTSLENVDEEFVKHHPNLKPGPYICLTIDDNGKGMDEETRSKIFEPFFTTKFHGRGLGMASAYGIVKNHDGWISVYSELGVGTVVRIYLPAIDVQVKAVEIPKIEPGKDAGIILLVEDEEIIIDVSRSMLKHLGYHVIVAKDGTEAINLVKTFEGDIALALLDIKLPDMEGGKVYLLIKDIRPNLKVIVCSGYSIEGPAQEILDAGAQGFIQKPFSLERLSVKLEEVLKGN
jgi:PAS domain S-box-containing protein